MLGTTHGAAIIIDHRAAALKARANCGLLFTSTAARPPGNARVRGFRHMPGNEFSSSEEFAIPGMTGTATFSRLPHLFLLTFSRRWWTSRCFMRRHEGTVAPHINDGQPFPLSRASKYPNSSFRASYTGDCSNDFSKTSCLAVGCPFLVLSSNRMDSTRNKAVMLAVCLSCSIANARCESPGRVK